MTKVPNHELRHDSLELAAMIVPFAGASQSVIPSPRAVPCGNCATCTCGPKFDHFAEAANGKPGVQIRT
ncbi:MAG: hypothetical protein DI533_03335 [Cereibacter sphaeroides]|uniref:Uncharacterized protein n=1 Tax=Cereibacter sphaeroides TaxID=1063 RepID=A0A2W5SFU9_CERSP|nr:MAG: hypothetical protein DI533_03335 [Cereibacter sphaeroides]